MSAPVMSAPADVLLYVQHLLGIGHVRRAAAIARALDRAGCRVVVVSGGLPVDGLDFGAARLHQLAPLRTADETFSALVDAAGRPIDEAWKAARAADLLALYRRTRPRLLLIELFPFGRRQLRFELIPLLEAAGAARPRPRVLCSLRDILNLPSKAEKTAWSLATLRRHFDDVLVHGDPRLVTLEKSFPAAQEIADRLIYTGYVVTEAPAAAPIGEIGNDVLVSTGGGAVARHLITAALEARALGAGGERPWRILVGHSLPEGEFLDLAARAPRGVTIERARRDFLDLLARCRASVSQAGYNTTIEVLRAGCPAVLVPFAGGSETEQGLRARVLAERGLVEVVAEAELSGDILARALGRASDKPTAGARRGLALDMGGAEKTAEIICTMLAILPR